MSFRKDTTRKNTTNDSPYESDSGEAEWVRDEPDALWVINP